MSNEKGRELFKLRQIVIGLCVVALFGAIYLSSYFFSVPQECECRSTAIPSALSEALILENSIGDSNSIATRIRLGRGELQICYSKMPKEDRRETSSPGLAAERCEYENSVDLEESGSRKSDIAAYFGYEISEQRPFVEAPREHLIPVGGALYINKNTNSCTFRALQWNGATLPGCLECADPVFYFKPWSLFPQTVELFYTRAFYAIHKGPSAAGPDPRQEAD